ncbi:hypothetical protein D3C72_1780680 [compost metagenome]
MRQGHGVRQFRLARHVRLDLRRHAALGDRHQARLHFAAFAIEQGDDVARRQAHDLNMVGDSLRQGDGGAGDERLGAEKTRHANPQRGSKWGGKTSKYSHLAGQYAAILICGPPVW